MPQPVNKKIPIIFNSIDAYDVGCSEGVTRLYNRILNYLSINDDRISVYKFFECKDNFITVFLSPENIPQYLSCEQYIKNKLNEVISSGGHFVYIGGNHLSILPILSAYREHKFNLLFLTFDSHIDADPSSLLGKERKHEAISISNYLSLFLEKESPIKFVHIGSKHPLRISLSNLNLTIFTVQDLLFHGENFIESSLNKIINLEKFDYLHIDIDLDVLDHSIMRATFDPSSMGLTLHQLLKIMRFAIDRLPLIGVDIVEYNPRIDPHIDYEEVCLRLFENMVYIIRESEINRKLWFSEK